MDISFMHTYMVNFCRPRHNYLNLSHTSSVLCTYVHNYMYILLHIRMYICTCTYSFIVKINECDFLNPTTSKVK